MPRAVVTTLLVTAGGVLIAAAPRTKLAATTGGSPPPAPITSLALVIGSSSSAACPNGTARVGAGSGWDSDFNDGAGGAYVYLCYGSDDDATARPITTLRAVTTPVAKPQGGACPAGYEQLEGNMNKGSKNMGFMYLCASHEVGLPPINQLLGEKASSGCSSGLEAVEGTDKHAGKPFNFDPAGVGVVLCASRPPAPITTLALAIGPNSTADTCPTGTTRITEGAGWDGDFNAGASGAYAYLCSGSSTTDSQITNLHAVVTFASGSAATSCPVGYEQLEGNMNQGSKNKRTVHLCVSRQAKSTAANTTAGSIVGLVGEKASTGCALGYEAVPGDDGQPFNFDPEGQGVVLCLHRAGGRGSCPPPPPAQPQRAIVTLTTVISAVAGACCPEGFEPVGPAVGASLTAKQWDGDLNSDAGGNFVYLCTSKASREE